MFVFSLLAIVLAILAELALIFGVIPHAIKVANIHPAQLVDANLDRVALTTGNIAIGIGVVAIVSIVGIFYLSKQTPNNRTGLIWCAVVALAGMAQLNAASNVADVLQLAQPTGKMVIDALTDIVSPAYIIVAALLAFAVRYAIMQKTRAAAK